MNLVLLGFGGHARSVADVALAAGYTRLWFVDENAAENERFLEFPVHRFPPSDSGAWLYMPCAGDNSRRQSQMRQINHPLATVISPAATIGPGTVVAPGCFVAHHAHIGPQSRVGAGCIINTGAVVEHDCAVGQCAHVSVHACVAGRSSLGDRVFLGAGSIVIDSISITSDVIVGAGGVVIASIDSPGVYVGVPARLKNSDR